MIGLNFADGMEANKFYDALITKITEKKRRESEKWLTYQPTLFKYLPAELKLLYTCQ